MDLINVEDIMAEMGLGPNGSLIFAMEFLEKNIHWLFDKLNQFKGSYFIIDMPGQVELYTNHNSLKNIIKQLQSSKNSEKFPYLSVAAVHLIDSQCCTDISKFISAIFLSLSATIGLELPFINVLSKMDLIGQYGPLPMSLSFYTELEDSKKLIDILNSDDSPYMAKYRKMNEKMLEIIDDFGLVNFFPLDINKKASMAALLSKIDKSNSFSISTFNAESGEKHRDLREEVAQNFDLKAEGIDAMEEEYLDDYYEEELQRDLQRLREGKSLD